MADAQLYPGAKWTPLGAQTEDRMTGHDIVCLHTMVGYLVSTDRYFRIYNGEGYAGTESHYGVGGKWGPDLGGGLDGAIWQWQDRAYTADANLYGNPTVISIETADNAPASADDIEPWTSKQVEAIARLLAWESSPAAHAKCPSTWACHQVGIPLVLIPDTKPGRRGIGYHQQGIDPWRVDGGVLWSKSYGKECPTRRRIAQIPGVITLAKEETMALTLEDAELVVNRLLAHKLSDAAGSVNNVLTTGFGRLSNTYDTLRESGAINSQLDRIEALAATPFDIDQLAAAIVAKLPVGTLTKADVQEACDAAVRARFAAGAGA